VTGEADSSADSEETEKTLTVTISPIGAVMPPIDGFHDMIDLEGWEKEAINFKYSHLPSRDNMNDYDLASLKVKRNWKQ
jgi:hypothetical protein